MKRTLFSVVALLLSGLPSLAQTYEQVAPKTPEAGAVPPLPSAIPPPAEGSDRIIIPALRGVVFLRGSGEVRPGGVETTGVQAGAVPLLDQPRFRAMVESRLGQPLTLRSLNQLVHDTVVYLKKNDRPIVDVLVPEQNVSGGTVQIVVLEGVLGRVTAEGTRWFSPERIARTVRSSSGQVIAGQSLLQDLSWLNQNPFRQVDLVFARGQAPGETDIVLRARDRRPLRLYAGYDDSGTALTGDERVQAGINWGNAFGLEHLLNYQFTASTDFSRMVAHAGSYVVPLTRWRQTFTVFGSYAESEPELEGGLFDLTGKSWQVSARHSVPLKSFLGLTHDVTGGIDFKRSNNNLAFGGMEVFAQETDVVQGSLAYSAARPDRAGATSLVLLAVYSPGGLSSGNHTSRFRASRAYADPEYAYGRLTVERTTRLPHGFTWSTRGVYQLSTSNLLGSEQLGLGGYDVLRGYEEREGNGDEGGYLINEIHAPAQRVLSRIWRQAPSDRLTPLAFLDCGHVRSHRRLVDEPSSVRMASAGVGVRYALSTHLTARLDYGWQLRDSGVSDGRLKHRGHFSLTVAY